MRCLFILLSIFFCTSSPTISFAISPQSIPNPRVPILVYHHIRETKPYPKITWSYKMSVSPKVFESQMQWLVDQGYTTIDLDTAIDVLAGKRSDIAKPVVITFDDNQLSAYDLAVPILKRNRQIAVFYLIANRLKHHGMIDESRVKNLVEAGMDIQSHSVTHSIMTKLTIKKLDQELGQSKEIIEAVTGKKVRHLAYPLTAQNKMVRERVKAAGYASATIMDPRVATSKDDLLKLPRIMMTDETEMSRILK